MQKDRCHNKWEQLKITKESLWQFDKSSVTKSLILNTKKQKNFFWLKQKDVARISLIFSDTFSNFSYMNLLSKSEKFNYSKINNWEIIQIKVFLFSSKFLKSCQIKREKKFLISMKQVWDKRFISENCWFYFKVKFFLTLTPSTFFNRFLYAHSSS